MARERLKKLHDLFVRGEHVKLPDGSYLWVQVLNNYERDDCLSAAQVARSRMVMALREKGDEGIKVMGHIGEVGYPAIVQELADVKIEDSLFRAANAVRDDPDWKERMEILDKTEDEESLSDEERDLITKLQLEFMAELDRRREEERELAVEEYQSMSDEELEEEYLKAWLDKKGGAAAQRIHGLWEVVYATRYCDEVGDNVDPHRCTSAGERVFESVEDVRHLPEELQQLIRGSLVRLAMSERDPKGLGNRPASSDSSASPNEPEVSMPSMSTETQPTPPGTSSRQSATV